ncbi:MAG: phosphatase PAP2 family protein [Myxococcales bacterium]|nr:phosphatase PAP2 family protein [Myxococcales bacterium]MDP3499107.1 phosphatase PAP2 family protein [Myxococcales bacterium]
MRSFVIASLLLLAPVNAGADERGDATPPEATSTGTRPASAAPTAPAEPPRGLFLGDDWRYRHTTPWPWLRSLVLRTLADLISIPSTVGSWSVGDWAVFAAVTAPTIAAFVPIDGRSADARLQDVLHQARGANCNVAPAGSSVCQSARPASFHLWTPASNLALGLTQVLTPLTLMLVGALAGNEKLLEASTLAAEALLVAQAYHVTLKLLTGREGVLHGTGAGTFFGPTRLSFPDGFPSGHSASLFALIGAYSTYVDAPWLHVLLLGVGGALATWLVLDDYHFASEVFFGAATGYLVGRWVVRHRAARPTTGVTWQAVTPVLSSQGAGLASSWTF